MYFINLSEKKRCQYNDIKPKILIEPLMRKDKNKNEEGIHVYCFSGEPKLFVRLYDENYITLYNEEFEIIDDVFTTYDKKVRRIANDLIKQTFVLSQKLAKPFNFVRVDWMVFEYKLSDFSSLKPTSALNKGVQNVNNTFERSDGFSVTSSSPPSEDSTLRKILFEELTFTPHSGFLDFCGKWNFELGNFLNLERIKNEF